MEILLQFGIFIGLMLVLGFFFYLLIEHSDSLDEIIGIILGITILLFIVFLTWQLSGYILHSLKN